MRSFSSSPMCGANGAISVAAVRSVSRSMLPSAAILFVYSMKPETTVFRLKFSSLCVMSCTMLLRIFSVCAVSG